MSDELGLEQDDCEMHVVQLLIGYTLDVKENTKTELRTDYSITGGKKKVTQIITLGGEFSNGHRIMTNAKEIGNFFKKSGQRKEDLDDAHKFLTYPTIATKNPADTRVAGVLTLYTTLLANKNLHDSMVPRNPQFTAVYKKMSEDDWETMCQMEGLLRPIHSYVVTTAQEDKASNILLRPFFCQCL